MLSLETFLQLLNRYCQEQSIPMAFARRYNTEAFAVTHADIDILLQKQNIPKIVALIKACPGLTLISRIDHLTNTQLYIHGLTQTDAVFLCLDIHYQLALQGMPYLNVSAVLLRCQPSPLHAGFEPDPIDLALIYLFTHIIKHANRSETAKQVLYQAYKTNNDAFQEALSLYFGSSGDSLINRLLKGGDIRPIRLRLRHAYCWQQFKQHGFVVFILWLTYATHTIWHRIFKRYDIRIAVIGTDGSGKTTLIQKLKESCRYARPLIVHSHVLPALPGRPEPDSNVVNGDPHAKPNRSWLVSNLKLIWFFFRYWLDALWPHRGSRLIFYDRYFIDIIADPRRFRFAGSVRLARWLLRFLPRLDAIIWLATPPQIAHRRKPELPLDIMQQQYAFYQDSCHTSQNSITLSGIELTDNVITDTISKLANLLTKRLV